MGRRLLAVILATIGCLSVVAAVSALEAVEPEADETAQQETGPRTPTPVAPTVGTGYRADTATFARGILAMGSVFGLALGGTLLAASVRSRRF